PAQVALINAYKVQAEPLMKRVVGKSTVAITRTANNHGESAMGDIIADSLLTAARKEEAKADVGFMHPRGIRTDIRFGDGNSTCSDLCAVQPSGNGQMIMPLTCADIEPLLRQQCQPGGNNILQVSDGFSFTWRQPAGKPIETVPGSVKRHGQPIVAT